jgi:hypothetical protein
MKLIGVIFGLCFAWNVYGASSERLRPEVPPAVQTQEVWHPRFPDKATDPDTYCNLWASKALYGIGAFLKASPSAKQKHLVITYQTSEEDRAHPEIFNTVEMDDGTHATVIVLTDGDAHGQKWMLDEEVKRQVEDAMMDGWDWAKGHEAMAESQRGAPMEAWMQFMYQYCKANNK